MLTLVDRYKIRSFFGSGPHMSLISHPLFPSIRPKWSDGNLKYATADGGRLAFPTRGSAALHPWLQIGRRSAAGIQGIQHAGQNQAFLFPRLKPGAIHMLPRCGRISVDSAYWSKSGIIHSRIIRTTNRHCDPPAAVSLQSKRTQALRPYGFIVPILPATVSLQSKRAQALRPYRFIVQILPPSFSNMLARTVVGRHSHTRGIAPSSLNPGLWIFNRFAVKAWSCSPSSQRLKAKSYSEEGAD